MYKRQTLDRVLPLAKELLKSVEFEQHPIRLIGLSVSNPKEEADEQHGCLLYTSIGDSQRRPRTFDETLEDKAGIDGFGSVPARKFRQR